MKAEHMPHSDCHITVRAKIKIELQCKAERAKPRRRDTCVSSAQDADFLPQGAGLVGDEHFLKQAHHKAQHSLLKSHQCEPPVMELFLNVRKAHDRTCHKLREHGHVGEIRRVAVFRLHLAAVQIDDIAHRLKRVKADTDRKVYPWLRKLCAKQSVYGCNGKIRILKKGKYGQVDANAAAQEKSSPALGRAKALH